MQRIALEPEPQPPQQQTNPFLDFCLIHFDPLPRKINRYTIPLYRPEQASHKGREP